MNTISRGKLQPFHWVGIDVSKPFFDAAVMAVPDQDSGVPIRELPVKRFQRTRAGVQKFRTWLEEIVPEETEPFETRVVMESTGNYSSTLAVWLAEKPCALCAAIVNPEPVSKFIQSLSLGNTTDRLSAGALALFGCQRRPAPYEPLSDEEFELRELMRYRGFLVGQRTAMKNHDGEGSHGTKVCAMEKRRAKQLDKDIATLETELREQVAHTEKLCEDIVLLESIYGVGFITAATVRLELGDLRRFERARQLSAFAGLSPRQFESGTSVRKRTRMSKAGSKRVRKVLYMAACSAIVRPNAWRVEYDHLRSNGKRPMEGIGALMRKILVLMRAILISGIPYDPALKGCGNNAHKLTKNAL